MQTDYYRPNSDPLTTISMVALAYCISLASPLPARQQDAMPTPYAVASPACSNPTADFYTATADPLDEKAQLAVLENFADKLLNEVVELPQATVNLLNERFWDLV